MPTLKQLVDGAIKAGSTWAYPNGNAITIEVAKREEWGSQFTAPADGIVRVLAYGEGVLYLNGYSTSASFWCRSDNPGGTILVKRGAGVAIYASTSFSRLDAVFVPASGQA